MNKPIKIFAKVAILAVALAVFFAAGRNVVYNAAVRLPHADEAEQATVFSKLDEKGEYKYSPLGSHGPTLYYYAKFAKDFLFPQYFYDLDKKKDQKNIFKERTLYITLLRLTLLVFPILTICSLLLMGKYVKNALVGAACFAFSSLVGIYSAYFVQETIFVFCVFAFFNLFWLFLKRPSVFLATVSGFFAGAAQSTKETFPIFFAAILAAGFLSGTRDAREFLGKIASVFGAAFLTCSIIVCAAVYSSFGENPSGFADMFSSYFHFLDKAAGNANHSSPFWYYITDVISLKKSEGFWFGELPIWILAAAGLAWGFLGKGDDNQKSYAKYSGLSALFSLLAFSAIPYKTPWLMLVPTVFACACAGAGAGAIISFGKTKRWKALGFAAVLALIGLQFKLEHNAAVKFANDPRNPLLYSATTRGMIKPVDKVSAAIRNSEYGNDTPVAVVMAKGESPWPLPWYFAKMRNVGYWNNGEFPKNWGDFEVVIVDSRLGHNLPPEEFEEEFGGLRKNLNLMVYTKKNLLK